MFFLLSGFIYSIIFDEQKKVPKLKPFMKERFFRLYPLHIVCTLLIFAITIYRTNLLNDTIYAIQTLTLHLTLTWTFFPKLGHHLNQPSWALSVFFLCYAVTPAFLSFLKKQNKRTLWLLLLGIWAILIFSAVYFTKLPNYFRGINFFSGMVLGKLFLNNAIRLPKRALLNDLLLLLAVILLFVNVRYFKAMHAGLSYHVVSPFLYSTFLLLLSNNKGIFVKILSVSWLRILGKASYYPYLVHALVIELLHLYLDKVALWRYNPFNNPLATVAIVVLLYTVCTAYSFRVKLYRSIRSFIIKRIE
jgi:peptidoglycan/LPS O-acetylase OafA/YrhL